MAQPCVGIPQKMSMLQAAEDSIAYVSVLLTKRSQQLIDSGEYVLIYDQDRETQGRCL